MKDLMNCDFGKMLDEPFTVCSTSNNKQLTTNNHDMTSHYS